VDETDGWETLIREYCKFCGRSPDDNRHDPYINFAGDGNPFGYDNEGDLANSRQGCNGNSSIFISTVAMPHKITCDLCGKWSRIFSTELQARNALTGHKSGKKCVRPQQVGQQGAGSSTQEVVVVNPIDPNGGKSANKQKQKKVAPQQSQAGTASGNQQASGSKLPVVGDMQSVVQQSVPRRNLNIVPEHMNNARFRDAGPYHIAASASKVGKVDFADIEKGGFAVVRPFAVVVSAQQMQLGSATEIYYVAVDEERDDVPDLTTPDEAKALIKQMALTKGAYTQGDISKVMRITLPLDEEGRPPKKGAVYYYVESKAVTLAGATNATPGTTVCWDIKVRKIALGTTGGEPFTVTQLRN
jgi:hypothetical protein